MKSRPESGEILTWLGLAILVAIVLAVRWLIRRRRKNAYRREALRELKTVSDNAAEISQLSIEAQLEMLTEFKVSPDDLENLDGERFGRLSREGKILYRYRSLLLLRPKVFPPLSLVSSQKHLRFR